MIFSHYQTRPLSSSNASAIMPLSTDLGLTMLKAERIPEGWLLPDRQILTFNHIDRINEEENGCFRLTDNELHKVEAFSDFTNRYYSLMPTPKSPTMLISGVPMHRIKDTTPLEDTAEKIKALAKPYGRILDTTTGLGYTAILAAHTAEDVITIEFDPVVLNICRQNPWSRELFSNPKIVKLVGDSYDLADQFEDEYFNAIIHDPPTFNLAGHLYSRIIYDTFYRILKSNGRLFHYIGNPESKSGASVGRGVVERLGQAGFKVTPKPRAFGVLAEKI